LVRPERGVTVTTAPHAIPVTRSGSASPRCAN